MQRIAQAAVVAALSLMMVGTKANAQNINVVINGQPVQFNGTPPQEQNGSVLVPLRGVFEQLGANVQYNPQRKTIFAQKDSTNVSLSLGSSTAYVNNQPEQLAQPPEVLEGTTLVPLRFVAEAFGAYVEWQAASNTVVIQTGQSGAVAMAPPSPEQGGDDEQTNVVSGKIVSIDSIGSPRDISIATDNGNVDIHVNPHTHVGLMQSGADRRPGFPSQLRVGDTVTVKEGADGDARSIDDSFTGYNGRIATVRTGQNGDTIVVLESGQVIPLGHDVNIIHGNQVDQMDLHRGMIISVRMSPGGHRAYSVDVQ